MAGADEVAAASRDGGEDEDERAWRLLARSRALIRAGDLDRAEAIVRSMATLTPREHHAQAIILGEISGYLAEAGQRQRAADLLREAERHAEAIESLHHWHLPEALAGIARSWVAAGEPEEAQRIWGAALAAASACEAGDDRQDSIDCASVLWEISEDLALAGQWRQAEEGARTIRDDGKRERALRNLADLRGGARGSFQRLREQSQDDDQSEQQTRHGATSGV